MAAYKVTLDDLKSFDQFGSKTPGHPEYGWTDSVEVTTGPLGQGFCMAVGLTIAEKHLAATYNRPGFNLVNHNTYMLCGDRDLMAGGFDRDRVRGLSSSGRGKTARRGRNHGACGQHAKLEGLRGAIGRVQGERAAGGCAQAGGGGGRHTGLVEVCRRRWRRCWARSVRCVGAGQDRDGRAWLHAGECRCEGEQDRQAVNRLQGSVVVLQVEALIVEAKV